MSIIVSVAAASTALTTAAAVKGILHMTSVKYDAELERLIGAATSAIEEHVQHVYAKQTYIESINGANHPLLMLTNTPIVSVTSIVCESSVVDDYSIHDQDAGILYRKEGWAKSGWIGWNSGGEGRRISGTGDLIYHVTYEAGYTTPGLPDSNLPLHIEQACIDTVVAWYRGQKRDPSVKSKKVGDLALTYKDTDGSIQLRLPAGARALLSRRVK